MKNVKILLNLFLGTSARLGENSSLTVNVLSNDFPNGIFQIDQESSTDTYGEDGSILSRDGNITFIRKYGSFYTAKVLTHCYYSTHWFKGIQRYFLLVTLIVKKKKLKALVSWAF